MDLSSIVSWFDSICFSWGDEDAIIVHDCHVKEDGHYSYDEGRAISYVELQEYSKELAAQLLHRFRPDYVLIEGQGHAAAEAVAVLACIRIGVPFVPISCLALHSGPHRLSAIAAALRRSCPHSTEMIALAAVVCGRTSSDEKDDEDDQTNPVIIMLEQQADIHFILQVDTTGNLLHGLAVPSLLTRNDEGSPTRCTDKSPPDCLYVLFTSGTSSLFPKAVMGSHQATLRRLQWWGNNFASETTLASFGDKARLRVARRTPLTFVDSITELFGSLLFPPSLLIAADPALLKAQGISALLAHQIHQITLLPSQLSHQVLTLPDEQLASLTRVIISGEVCSPALVPQFVRRLPHADLINLYGQTETTGDLLCAVLTKMPPDQVICRSIVAVGKPILPDLTVSGVPAAASGDESLVELTVSGKLSLGYLPGTRAHTEHNFSTSFATGDLGFERDGTWYVEGRRDDVLQISGIWTCPSEVEAAFWSVYKEPLEKSETTTLVAVAVDQKVYIVLEGSGSSLGSSATCQFARIAMHQAGTPWHLIPTKVLIVPRGGIPRQSSGAGKVDQNQLRRIVRDQLQAEAHADHQRANVNVQDTVAVHRSADVAVSLESVVATVLDLTTVDGTKSFVELGGNSALAIALLHQLRRHDLLPPSNGAFTALNLLKAESIDMIRDGLKQARLCKDKSGPSQKRQRLDGKSQQQQQPQESQPHDIQQDRLYRGHFTVEFNACVDASPLVINSKRGTSVLAGCQGGVIKRVVLQADKSWSVASSTQLVGWRVQAGFVLADSDRKVLVSSYSAREEGCIRLLDVQHLEVCYWQREIPNGALRTTPVVDGNGFAWICSGKQGNIMALSSLDGTFMQSIASMVLPMSTVTGPLLVGDKLIYASSEYETGLMVIDPRAQKDDKHIKTYFQDAIGPVFKNIVYLKESDKPMATVADSYGTLHRVQLDSMTCEAPCYVSNLPLTSPKPIKENKLVVGSYDGTLRCIDLTTNEIKTWEHPTGAVLYTSPLVLRGKEALVLVCTTAGDVMVIHGEQGQLLGRLRVNGEIWSDAAQVDEKWITFGARDSRLHFIDLSQYLKPTEEGT